MIRQHFARSKGRWRYVGLAAVFAVFFLFEACTLPSLPGFTGNEATVTPSPTIVMRPSPTSGFYTVNSPVCKMGEWGANLTQTVQGNQMAWSPKADILAFLYQKDASWYVGDLSFVQAPSFNNLSDPIPDTAAYGNVTWAPDGSLVAFVSLRQTDGLYTVMVARPDGSQLRDLFPGKAAKTDSYASPKSIMSWTSLGFMQVEVSCGPDCLKTAEVDPVTGQVKLAPDTRREKDALGGKIARRVLDYDKTLYPSMTDPNWSYDGNKVAYFTGSGEVWVIDVPAKTRYPIDMNRVGQETQWSQDDRYLAVRTDRWVSVYAWGGCPNPGS